ncbi:MAG TPA: ABC transporter permease subunit [Actinopolymorphaceae bacterium]
MASSTDVAHTTSAAPHEVDGPHPDRRRRRRRTLRSRLHQDKILLLFALPGVVYFLCFHYLPLLGNVVAFKDYQPFIGILDSPWVGLENFEVIVSGDPEFLNALKNTLIITVLQLIFTFPAPIALALLMNSLISERLKRLVQSILYLPHFLSWVVVVALFQTVLGYNGPLDQLMGALGGPDPSIIGNPDFFKPLVIIQDIWKNTGWGTILFLAALAGVNTSLYEAAAVDGASRWRQLWHVTLPGIRPVIILVLILRLGDVLSVGFEQIILQQNAVGLRASEVLDTYIYNFGVVGGSWGTSAAVGLVKGVVGVILVLLANKLAHVFGEDGIYRGVRR